MNRLPFAAAVALAAGFAEAPTPAPAAPADTTLQVFAAASLTEAFGELGMRLERARPGLRVRFNFAGSQQLAAQIDQGARADLFAPADETWMVFLRRRGRLLGPAPVFAGNRMVAIVPAANRARIDSLQDLARPRVKLVLAAQTVPAGRYARKALLNLARAPGFAPDFGERALANLVSSEENVKAVVAKVQLGEADAGIVYRSDVTPALVRKLKVLEIPEAQNAVARYSIGVLKDAPSAHAARAFVDLLLSDEGQGVLERHGLLPLAALGRAPTSSR